MQNYANSLSGDAKQKAIDNANAVKDSLDKYTELVHSSMASTSKDIQSVDNEIASVYRDTYLNTIADVQSKYEEILKKQRDERISQINKEKDAEIDRINKVSEAYQKANEKEDFDKQLAEENQKLANINNQIASAKLAQDSAGKARLSDLLKQQTDQQKVIDDMVLERQRTLNGESLDAQQKAIEDSAQSKIDALNKKFSDENITTMVGKALETNNGLIKDINGNLVSMQDLYLTWAEKFGEGLGIMGDKIETEFLGKLKEAQYYMTQMGTVYSTLGIKDYDSSIRVDTNSFNNSKVLGAIDLSKVLPTYSLANNLPILPTPTPSTTSTSSKSVTVQGDLFSINVTGNTTDEMLSKFNRTLSDAINKFREEFNSDLTILGYS